MKKVKSDQLGDRMKRHESVTQNYLAKRCYAIIRLDGRSFSSFTRKVKSIKPFDINLMNQMNQTALAVCKDVSAVFGYCQSDEISILISDIENINKQLIFDGNVQKIVSTSAAMATAVFNSLSPTGSPLATFDARVFNISDPVEVYNYFKWRTADWERNSIQMLSRSKYSHKELQGKKISDMHELLHKKDTNWAKLPDEIKRGRLIVRDMDAKWQIQAMFKLPEQKTSLQALIPSLGYE